MARFKCFYFNKERPQKIRFNQKILQDNQFLEIYELIKNKNYNLTITRKLSKLLNIVIK